jgi:hypothetical protein
MLNGTKIIMTANHSLSHDTKKRTKRKTCAIHRQERCNTHLQGPSNKRKHPVSSNSHTDKWKTILPLQTKTTPIEKHDTWCNNKKENNGDRME